VFVLAEGFTLGLSTGLYCLGACAPLLVPFVLIESKSIWRSNLWLVGQFLLGRLVAYLLFAVIASLAGYFTDAFLPSWLIPAAFFLSGCIMLLYALGKQSPSPRLCAVASKYFPAARFPLVLGFLVGINICPPFVAGMTRVFSLNNVALSVLYFAAFFVGTSLYILPMVLVTTVAQQERLKSIGWLSCVLAGIWFCVSGFYGLW
jgi:sulfite exporter TauE/SafE